MVKQLLCMDLVIERDGNCKKMNEVGSKNIMELHDFLVGDWGLQPMDVGLAF